MLEHKGRWIITSLCVRRMSEVPSSCATARRALQPHGVLASIGYIVYEVIWTHLGCSVISLRAPQTEGNSSPDTSHTLQTTDKRKHNASSYDTRRSVVV